MPDPSNANAPQPFDHGDHQCNGDPWSCWAYCPVPPKEPKR